MKRQTHISILVLILLVAGLAVLVAACSQSDQPSAQGTPVSQVVEQAESSLVETPDAAMSVAAGDSLSTFAPKDPFIQQALPPEETSTTVTTDGGGGTTITTIPGGGGTTTTFHWTTTTRSSGGGGTTTTTAVKPTTTTTAPHLHTLKILSVATVSGTPVVTFKVDNTTYKDKRTGDVVSTTWGQVKVVDISTSSKVVTLLHGSETLILAVGQSTFE